MRDKLELTQQLVDQLDPDLGITVKSATSTWWFNIRKNGGLRLTGPGFDIFKQHLNLAHYEFEVDPLQVTQQLILALDRKMQTPYYIHAVKGVPRKIVLFGSREALLINLYRDLKHFIDSYQP